jgi:dethiobiotin synthetase
MEPMTNNCDSANRKLHGLFVTGTNTSVGKTYVTCHIIRQLVSAGIRVGAYKPVCSGAGSLSDGELTWEDISRLSRALGGNHPDDRICPQRFLAPLAPPLAAARENRRISWEILWEGLAAWDGFADFLLIEGAGGFLCPLTDDTDFGDFATELNWPVLVVAGRGLGTINHTLLTLEAVRARGLSVAGVVLNSPNAHDADQSTAENGREIARRGAVEILGVLPFEAEQLLSLEGLPVSVNWLECCKSPNVS